MVRYVPRPTNDAELRARLKALAEQYPRYGCPTLNAMLRHEGMVRNHKRTHRIYTEERLQVRTKQRKKLARPRVPMLVPMQPNERWSVDFMSDQLADARRFRILDVVDDFSRECVGQLVDTSISGARLARFLTELGRSLPETIVCDNGPELTCEAMLFWARDHHVKLHFIQPGKPTQTLSSRASTADFERVASTSTGSDHCSMLAPRSMLGVGTGTRRDHTVHCNS